MAGWLNSDGLFIKFGTEEGYSVSQAGESLEFGPEQSCEIVINLTDLTETESIQNDVAVIPDDCLITQVEIVTLIAGATGTAIDLGLVHISRDTADAEFTADPDGLLAAFAVGDYNLVGEKNTFTQTYTIPASQTGTGALIGELTTAPTLITCSRTTSTAFTAGRIQIKVRYLPNALTGIGSPQT